MPPNNYFNMYDAPPAYATFPAMQGYGAEPIATPYLDSMNAPAMDMRSILSGTPAPTAGPLANVAGGASAASPNFWSMDSFLGSPGQQGWGGLALGAASGLMNGFIGLQQLGVAKKTLAQNERQFNLNFGAQQKMTNSRLADRQATRVASGMPGATAVSDYMKQYGI